MGENSQSQKAGQESTQIQAGGDVTINCGVTEERARAIAHEVFRQNALELAGTARDTLESRADAFTNSYLSRQMEYDANALTAIGDPDFLYALFSAQRDYARTGTVDLQELLLDLLVQRTTAQDLSRIVLNAAIEVAAKLTREQLDTLSLILLLVHNPPLSYGFTSLGDFHEYLRQYIAPLIHGELENPATYFHLKYAGCASMDSGGVGVIYRLTLAFPGCFTLGFDREKVMTPSGSGVVDLLIPCFHNQARWQFKPSDELNFRSLCAARGLDETEINFLLQIQSAQFIAPESAWELVINADPKLKILRGAETFRMDGLTSIQLTTVGIALANVNLRHGSRAASQVFFLPSGKARCRSRGVRDLNGSKSGSVAADH